MSRNFAQIECGLPHSKKTRSLTHQERWAYLCTHFSPMCGYIGLFRYPLSVWADDADLTRSDLEAAIENLARVGLIEYDLDEEVVRICSWFFKKNAPENASRMASMSADYSELDAPDEMLMASAAEFSVGSIARAQRWRPDSSEWEKLRDVFKPFLASMAQNFEDDFKEHLLKNLTGQKKAVKAELCSIMPTLEYYLQSSRCPHPDHTVGAYEDDTRRHQYKDENRDEDDIDTAKTATNFIKRCTNLQM